MALDWKHLTELTRGREITVEKVKLADSGVAIEGSFELPPLAQLSMEDQVFVATFVKTHGSIKEMERLFGVSYPTIKNRLNRISEALGYGVVTEPTETGRPENLKILDRLERGEITAQEAVEALRK